MGMEPTKAPETYADLQQKLDDISELLRITEANYEATIKTLAECLNILGINYGNKGETGADTE